MPDRYEFMDFIPPIGPIAVEMECAARPKAVRLVPEGAGDGGGWDGVGGGEGAEAGMSTSGRERGGNKAGRLKWTWRHGRLRVTVPRLEIHSILVIN
jgi:hypothetical protein